MIKINLVPPEILAKARQRQQNMQALLVAVLGVILLVAISFFHWSRYRSIEQKLAANQEELRRLEAVVAKVEELERTSAAVKARLGVITDLLKSRPLYPYFMSDFARSVPLGVRVKTMGTNGGGSSAGALRLNISAESRTNDDIAVWVRNMEESGKFAEIELGAVTAAEGAAEKVYSFTLTTTYKPTL
ncbi:MAG: PilN domain-containing protein [Elusimicrobia bacterium]|nr:PilN domain-containing protein [Elusimicrobiota bacterium]